MVSRPRVKGLGSRLLEWELLNLLGPLAAEAVRVRGVQRKPLGSFTFL